MRRGSFFSLCLAALFVLSLPARADGPLAPTLVKKPEQKAAPAITVFAASSLQEAFRTLAGKFTAARGIPVSLSFAGSQELRTQLEQGAQADVFASADLRHADALEHEGLLSTHKLFASNALVIAIAKGNPENVHSVSDLARLKHVVVGAHEVPVGLYAEKLFAMADARAPGLAARIDARISSRELNVRQVLAKVALGEAEAGIVYQTDARAMATQVDFVSLPPELEQATQDVIAVLSHAPHSDGASAFVDYVLSKEAQAELQARGFKPVSAP